ncbi:tyrosine-type recombinase/integrase [Neobacillus novalis]|uniref:tyrosine-type recombinase/integrase n=2 Tax=Neobacillus novalis TaxID=220687 RepID=UPI000826C85E|nr:hypothetical protein [Neobacillus novalis]
MINVLPNFFVIHVLNTVRKGKRKLSREVKSAPRVMENFTMTEMFERFMWFKNSEGLAPRTIEEYMLHFQWLLDYLGGDLAKEEMTLEVFLDWIVYMKEGQGLKPTTVNMRVRTTRAFLRWCNLEKYIDYPIHERVKPIKTEQDTLESFTPSEVKALLNAFDETTFVGFRDRVMTLVLLDSMVRISELINILNLIQIKFRKFWKRDDNSGIKDLDSAPILSSITKLVQQ